MSDAIQFLKGEFSRKLDERYRLSLPNEFEEVFKPEGGKCILAKERPGCLSLWDAEKWRTKLDARVDLVLQRLKLGDLEQKMPELQVLGRLLSTRHKEIALAGRGRLVVPEGFREFLALDPGQEAMVIWTGLCVEIWHPTKWIAYIEETIPEYRNLLDALSH